MRERDFNKALLDNEALRQEMLEGIQFDNQIQAAVQAHKKSWEDYVNRRLSASEIDVLKAATAAEYEAWLDSL